MTVEVHLMVPDCVLVVDDEPVVRDVLALALQQVNLTVRTAAKVSEALKVLEEEPIGCILVDKNLGDGSGLELVKQAQRLRPYAACIVMTGYPNAASILESLRFGAVDYLEKPFPQMALVQEKVKAAIARQRVISERDALKAEVHTLGARSAPVEHARRDLLVMALRACEATLTAVLNRGGLPPESERELRAAAGALAAALGER